MPTTPDRDMHRPSPRNPAARRTLSGLALLCTSASLAGCALSGNSAVTFETNAQVPETAPPAQSHPHFEQRFERLAGLILHEASTVPADRRQSSRAKGAETRGFSLPLKGGGLIFMEVKGPLDTHDRTRHRIDVHRAVEVYVEQQGTPNGDRDFGLDITQKRRKLNASCEHGRYAVAEFDAGNASEAVFDVGKKNKGYRGGQAAANRLLGRMLDSASHQVSATDTQLSRVTAHGDACQDLTMATFGHDLRG
jgi:hypothetical protein